MANVYMSDGTLLKRETATPGTYTTIPGVMNITPPKWTRKTADVYVMDQSAPVVKTGAYEAQEVTFELAWDPADTTHQSFFTDADSKASKNYKIVFPDSGAAEMGFAAVVSSIEPADANAEGGDPLKLSVTLKLAAAATITW